MYALILCLALAANTQNPVNKNISAKHKQKQSAGDAKSKTPALVPINTPNNQPSSQSHPDQNQTTPDGGTNIIEVAPQSDSGSFTKVAAISTLLIAGINLGMLIAMWRQRKVMSGQLTEMKQNREETVREMQAAGQQTKDMLTQIGLQVGHLSTLAIAAKKNADIAELTAERFAQMEGARIIVGVDWTGVNNRTFNDDGSATMFIRVTCVHQGRSTAWVKQIRMQADVFHNTIPADPDFITIPIIYSGIKAIEPQKDYISPETPSVPARDSLDHWVIVWGIVEYADMFADRTATFGYIEKINDRWERLSYPAYNRNTFKTKKD
jgi:hypothetical protein